jgi:hypothetical protein
MFAGLFGGWAEVCGDTASRCPLLKRGQIGIYRRVDCLH